MALLVSNAFASGKHGQQVVASLAEAQLSAKTHAEVNRIKGELLQTVFQRYQLRYQTSPEARKNKGFSKKSFEINDVFWLLDLGSNQGPTD